jgi:hypothetical protein
VYILVYEPKAESDNANFSFRICYNKCNLRELVREMYFSGIDKFINVIRNYNVNDTNISSI